MGDLWVLRSPLMPVVEIWAAILQRALAPGDIKKGCLQLRGGGTP
jgi:hypothetical protein